MDDKTADRRSELENAERREKRILFMVSGVIVLLVGRLEELGLTRSGGRPKTTGVDEEHVMSDQTTPKCESNTQPLAEAHSIRDDKGDSSCLLAGS